jgi:hypothetical protein
MRYIAKEDVPACLQNWVDAQLAMEETVNVTYAAFPSGKQLLEELTDEQFGLCGYTGAPVDEGRVSSLKISAASPAPFGNHIEHLKSQAVCKKEVRSAGLTYRRVLGDDLNYHNMIAALEVKGSEVEQFGAAIKKDKILPIFPTDPECHDHFSYREDGGVDGRTEAGSEAISLLRLDHQTLCGWRVSAINEWLDDDILQSREDIHEIITALRMAIDGKLPEFSFVIDAIASGYLDVGG